LRDTYGLRVGTDVAKIHDNDRTLCTETADCANRGIDICVALEDDTSRELVESILAKEEGRIDWLESQLQVIKDAGLGLYLSQQMRKR
jgi:bacterioferritin